MHARPGGQVIDSTDARAELALVDDRADLVVALPGAPAPAPVAIDVDIGGASLKPEA